MNALALRLLQGLLWFVCLGHVVIGSGAFASADFQRNLAPLYGAEVVWTEQLTYTLRMLGAFMLVLGLLAGVAALDPLRWRPIVYGLSGVMTLRFVQRVLFYREAVEGFHLNPTWYFTLGGFFLALAFALLVLLQLARRPDGGVR